MKFTMVRRISDDWKNFIYYFKICGKSHVSNGARQASGALVRHLVYPESPTAPRACKRRSARQSFQPQFRRRQSHQECTVGRVQFTGTCRGTRAERSSRQRSPKLYGSGAIAQLRRLADAQGHQNCTARPKRRERTIRKPFALRADAVLDRCRRRQRQFYDLQNAPGFQTGKGARPSVAHF